MNSPGASAPYLAPHALRTATAEIEWPIELLHIFAALLVVTAHYLPHATQNLGIARFTYTGVDLFFVITGYVFARNLTGGVGTLKAYALRRFSRIYPLYLVTLLAYVAIRALHGGQLEYLDLHLFFLHTLESREIAFFYNPAFWSLPPEVEFLPGAAAAGTAGQAYRFRPADGRCRYRAVGTTGADNFWPSGSHTCPAAMGPALSVCWHP